MDTPKQDLLQCKLSELPFVVFDLETTGGNPEKSGLTEVFGIEYNPQKGTGESFYSLVNPQRRIPPIVRKITGITNDMVRHAPVAKKVMPDFFDFIQGKILVSHNTLCDLKFLDYYSQKLRGSNLENFFLCTHLLSEKLLSESPNKSLKGLCEFLSIQENPNHRAKADTLSTLELLKVLLEKLAQKEISLYREALHFQGDLASALKVGWNIPEAELKAIPSSLGVLTFKKKSDQKVFSMASRNCKKLLRSLSQLNTLPKGLARELLQSDSLSFEAHENLLEANLTTFPPNKSIKNHPLDIRGHRPMRSLGICLRKQDENFEALVSQVSEATNSFFGPFYDYKEANRFLRFCANKFFHKELKKGRLVLNHHEASDLQLILNKQILLYSLSCLKRSLISFRVLDWLYKPQVLMNLKRQSHSFSKLRNLRQVSGLLFVPNDNDPKERRVYSIRKGLILDTLTINTPYGTWLSTHDGSKFVENFLSQLAPQKKLEEKALSQKEAHIMNLVLWMISSKKSPRNKTQSLFLEQSKLTHSTLVKSGKVSSK